MKNVIEYYYNIKIDELHNRKDYYSFYFNNRQYVFKPYLNDINKIHDIYYLNNIISRRINIDNIILNKYNDPITNINNINYILIQNGIKNNISLRIISNMASIVTEDIRNLERNNWEILWANKIDYFEQQVGENAKKFLLIRESFDYYIGLAENAISYLVNTKKEIRPEISDRKVISHNNIDESFTDPSNIILDHKGRDVAEYIKLSFFNNNYDIFKELDEYFRYNYYSLYGIRVLYSRVLYPSFYFNLYDKIVSDQIEEKEINNIINKTKEYEIYLYNIYLYLQRFYDIPLPEWLKKQGINPRL